MKLWIAEKPNVGRIIAAELPGPHREHRGWIECGEGHTVTWCIGHLLEQAPPEAYDEALKVWRLAHLPIVPARWRLVPRASSRAQLEIVGGLLSRASSVVHAGDNGREGQLLVDEILGFFKFPGEVQRVRINDLNPPAVRTALAALHPNSKFFHLSQSALARQRADWLFGMNLTRLFTLKGREGGHDAVLSVGRVQTPVLALVVARDLEIENFRPKPYYVLRGTFSSAAGDFTAAWRPGPSVESHLDPEGRLLDRTVALELARRLTGQPGVCTKAVTKKETEVAPLPYSLVDLQVEADRLFGFTAQKTLDVAQALYEVHKLTTYPRSDCAYLPEGQLADAPTILAALRANTPSLATLVDGADPARRSRAFDDSKTDEHHAIIPTSRHCPAASLSADEAKLYELVARRYLAQFYGPHVFNSARLEITTVDELFVATGRQTLDPGWRVLLPAPAAPPPGSKTAGEEGDDERAQLPRLAHGDRVTTREVVAMERKTRPPKRFTDGTLLQAMTGISKYVQDPQIRKVLNATDGIGTGATRAAILETLFKREFLVRAERHILSTSLGRRLVAAMPRLATSPDLTAIWELALQRISEGRMSLDEFLAAMLRQLQQLIDIGKSAAPLHLPGAQPCPAPGCGGVFRRRKSPKGPFWGCSRYPDCASTQVC